MRRAALTAGAVLYLGGAGLTLVWIMMVATADTSLIRLAGPAAPALELQPGRYEIREEATDRVPSPETSVFALKTRERLPLVATGSGRAFEVRTQGIYVVDLRTDGASSSVHERQRLVLSPTLILALAVGPVAALPGLFLLDGAGPPKPRHAVLGRSRFTLAGVRRRLVAVVFDLIAIAGLLILLLLAAPLLSPAAPLIPLAPIAYVWSGNARGASVGRWLTGIRVVDASGGAPGPWRGLLRSGGWLLSWGLFGGGYAAAALSASGRAPHDELAGTYVVHD